MSQFKRFNASENRNWNSSDALEEGTLTWDPDNGLRIHDGSTGGGNSVGGGFSGNFYDLYNRPNGNTAVHDLQGGSSSALNGNFLKQTSIGVSEWVSLPTTYDTLTINTKVLGGLVGAAGTQITGIEGTLGSGQPWQFAFINTNSAFSTFYDQGSSIIGWKMYPAADPSAFVTVTEYLNNNQLGAPGLGFDGSLGQGPWVAESADYTAGTPGPLTLSSGTHNVTIGTNGNLTLPAGMNISQSIAWSGSQIFEDSGLIVTSNNVALEAGNDVTIGSDGGGTLWRFDSNGQLTFPNGSVQTTAYTGGGFSGAYDDLSGLPTLFDGDYNSLTNKPTYKVAVSTGTGPGGNNQADSLVLAGLNPEESIKPYTYGGDLILQGGYGGSNGDLYGEVRIKSGQIGANYEWHFTVDRKIKLPAGGDIVDSTGASVLGGGFSGSYTDLTNKPTIFSGAYADLTGKPSLATVATSGSYNDLTNKPSSFSGSYTDLTNKPTIPVDISNLTDTTGLITSRYITKNANFTAEVGKTYWLDSGTSSKTVTLPASPTAGDWVKIYDGSLNWQTYNLTVNGNGHQIRNVNMMGAPTWNSAANSITVSSTAISPTGPLASAYVWNGSYWFTVA